MKPPADELNELLTKGAFGQLVDFLLDLTPDERSELAKPAMARLRGSAFRRDPDGRPTTADGAAFHLEIWNAARLAVFATNPFPKVSRLYWVDAERFSNWTEWRQQLYRLVRTLRPAWLGDWAEAIVRQSLDNWAFVRRMIRDGLCEKPTCAEYTLGMMQEIRWRFSSRVWDDKGGTKKELASVQEALLEDADLLKEDLWRIFEIEGNSECNLQSLEPVGYSALAEKHRSICDPAIYSWRYALVDMEKHGRIPRARLLDASLAALARGFAPHRAGWFARLHEELKPTVEESRERSKQYLQLLGSPNPNTVTFALDALVALDKEKPHAGADVLQCIEPALALKAKATVKAALQWLVRIAKREPDLVSALVQRVTTALYHEASDVQSAAFTFIETFGDRSDLGLRERLEPCRKGISATLRPRWDEWMTPPEDFKAPAPSVAVSRSPNTRPRSSTKSHPLSERTDVRPPQSRLDPALAIMPIATFDELLDRAAFVLANSGAVDEAERVLDGLLRLGARRPPDFEQLSAPLLQLALKAFPRAGRFGMEAIAEESHEWLFQVMQNGVTAGLMALVLASWARGKPFLRVNVVDEPVEPESHFPLHYNRLAALTSLLMEGIQLPLLSAPTHKRGWIDPEALVERLKSWRAQDRPVEPHDFALALLRLAPENREAALRPAAKLGGETGDALCYALSAEGIGIGPTPAFWIAATRARNPFLDDPVVEQRHPGLGPDAGMAVRFQWQTEPVTEHFKNPFLKGIAEMAELKPLPNSAFITARMNITYAPALPKRLETALVSVMMHAGFSPDGFNYKQAADQLRWTFTLWPASREPLFASIAQWLMDETNGFEYRQGYRHPVMQAAFEPLTDSHTWLGPMASLLLTLALLSPDAPCRGLGVDVLVASVEDGRFNAEIIGAQVARLLPTTLCKCSRLVQSFREVSRVSPRHALAVADVLERIIRGDPAHPPRDLGKLLELWRELQAEHSLHVTDPDTRKYLACLQSGQAAKLAKQLLAATD